MSFFSFANLTDVRRDFSVRDVKRLQMSSVEAWLPTQANRMMGNVECLNSTRRIRNSCTYTHTPRG